MFYDRFANLCAQKGVSASFVVQQIGLNKSSATYWKNGAIPKGDTLQKLADYFGVSVDYLLGKEPERDMSYLNDLHYHGIIAWSEDKFFSASERIAIKEHLDDLLIRYKALIEATQRCKMSLRGYLNAIEQFNSESETPLSKRELIERYLAQTLEREQKDLCGWIEAAPFYFSAAMEQSLGNTATATQDAPQSPPPTRDDKDTISDEKPPTGP